MNKRFFKLLGASTIFLTLLSYGYQEEKMNYYIPLKVSKPPVIDGHLSEGFWKKAKKISEFIRTDGKKATQQTTVMVCYDDNNLYFGIESQEPNINQIRKDITSHGGSVWEDDSIEIFIAPDYLRRWSYYHFVANTLGTKYERGINTEKPSGLFWQVRANVERDRWIMEISIPFSTLGIVKEKKKNLFGVSVCRERWAGKPEFSCWPVGGNFHNPSGSLLFTDYKRYLREEVFPVWEQEKQEVYKLLRSFPMESTRLRKNYDQLVKSMESCKKELLQKGLITQEVLDSFLEKMEDNKRKIQGLKTKIKFILLKTILNEGGNPDEI